MVGIFCVPLQKMTDMIRKATKEDIPRLMDLLYQVNRVHYQLRPDIFKPNTTKYSKQELEALLNEVKKPIFVYDDGEC